MKIVYILITIGAVLILHSCESKKDQSAQASELYNQSMKIHDEVMPRMDEMFTLRQKLTHHIDSLKTDSVANETSIRQVWHAIRNLEQADKAMMDWMHNIKDVPGTENQSEHAHHASSHEHAKVEDPDVILKTQTEQKAAIEKVKADMETSILSAKKILSKSNLSKN